MKSNIKVVFISGIVFAVFAAVFFFGFLRNSKTENQSSIQSIKTENFSSTLIASGAIEAQNQAVLSFLASGRVAYLGVREGDVVQSGEVLANLDTTISSHAVTAAEAEYRSAKAELDKILDDIHLFQYGNGGFPNVGTANETQTQKTQRQQAEEAANISYDNLQSAQKQLQLQSIVAPFDGKVLSVQNIFIGTNISPVSGSSINIIGGGELKFVANILEQDIDQIHVGQSVTITIDGKKDLKLNGKVLKIASGKITLPDGRNVFRVDIQSNDLQTLVQPGQTGSIEISISQNAKTVVPSWIILENKYMWVESGGQPKLREVNTGQTISGKTQINSGLSAGDRVILDPQIIAKNKYKLL